MHRFVMLLAIPLMLGLIPEALFAGGSITAWDQPAPPPATSPSRNPPSHPQTLISGGNRKEISDGLVSRLMAKGWRVTKTTDYSLEFEQDAKGFAVRLLLGTRFNMQPVYRMAVGLSDVSSGVLVTAGLVVVSNPHSGFENSVALDNKKQEAPLWEMLEILKRDYSHAALPPPEPEAAGDVIPETFHWPFEASNGQVTRASANGITSLYDRFEDSRIAYSDTCRARLLDAADSGTLIILAQLESRGDTLIAPMAGSLLFFGFGDQGPALRHAARAVLLSDSTRIVLDSLHVVTDANGCVVASAHARDPAWETLARAKRIEGRVGETDFVVDGDAIDTLNAIGTLYQSTLSRSRASTANRTRATRASPK